MQSEGQARICHRFLRVLLTFLSLAISIAATLGAQAVGAPPDLPTLKRGEKADILLVGRIPKKGEKGDDGKPALAALEPVVFVSDGQLRTCFNANAKANEPVVPKTTIDILNNLYTSHRSLPLWRYGSVWGTAKAVSSCIDGEDGDYIGFDGCFSAQPTFLDDQGGFEGVVWTGSPLKSTHGPVHRNASPEERSIFLNAAARVFAEHHVPISPTSIHSSPLVLTALQSGHIALAGSALVQLSAAEPLSWYSYRLFLVLEQDSSDYRPVLARFHRTTIRLDGPSNAPKRGEVLDEEGDTDREEFLAGIPLFPNEPDAIITEHHYYEDWAFSLYRRVGDHYELLTTGCGGGD